MLEFVIVAVVLFICWVIGGLGIISVIRYLGHGRPIENPREGLEEGNL